jgi:phosphatidylserine/phosphatidylglycerophosphate/cardiolipin synthase-like enzyme
MDVELLSGEALHRRVIQEALLGARRRVWIATANLKDMQLAMANGRYQPILAALDRLCADGVAFRVVHADLPSRPFRRTLERFPRLTGGGLELQVCPRSHWKLVLVDGQAAYCGSANFTGAGLGARAERRRNLEIGVFSRDPTFVRPLEELYDAFWRGEHCPRCAFRRTCPDPIGPEG